jgi:hypothetical protein
MHLASSCICLLINIHNQQIDLHFAWHSRLSPQSETPSVTTQQPAMPWRRCSYTRTWWRTERPSLQTYAPCSRRKGWEHQQQLNRALRRIILNMSQLIRLVIKNNMKRLSRKWKPLSETRSALFWDITQRRVVILHRRFGTTICPIFKGQEVQASWTSWPLGPIGCRETSVQNYHSTLRNIPEERRSHQHRGGSLKFLSDMFAVLYCYLQLTLCWRKINFMLLGNYSRVEYIRNSTAVTLPPRQFPIFCATLCLSI